MRDWPPCPPIQRGGGRRSRPGVTPFISALTVARCPATFPGVWPQLRDTLSTSRSVGRGTGAFIYLPPFSENSPIFCSFPFAKIQPVFLTEQTGRIKHRTPFPPSATPAGITHYTLQARPCAKGEAMPPLWKPPVLSACGHSPQSCARVPTPPKPKETAQTSPPPRADLRRFFVRPAGRDGRKNAGGKLRFRVAIFDKLGYNKFNPNRRLQHERSG